MKITLYCMLEVVQNELVSTFGIVSMVIAMVTQKCQQISHLLINTPHQL